MDGLDGGSSAYSGNQRSNRRGAVTYNNFKDGRLIVQLSDNDEESKYEGKNHNFILILILINVGYNGKIVLDAGDGKSGNRESDPNKKKKIKKKQESTVSQYLQEPKRQNMGSKRRQNTPESQFNEALINVIDSCITFDNTGVFHQPVKKKDVPTYYDVIKNPMDLGTLKSKAKRCEFSKVEQFQAEIKLLHTNSVQFNGPDHPITIQAGNVVERAELLIQADLEQLTDLEKRIVESSN